MGDTSVERVLAAAAELIEPFGADLLSMSALQMASGVSTGSIYHHFRSREGLLIELMRDLTRTWSRELLVVFDAHADAPAEALREAIRRRLAWAEERPGAAHLLLHERRLLAKDAWAVEDRRLNERLDAWLARQASAGRLPAISPGLGFPLAFAPVEETVRRWLVSDRLAPPSEHADALAAAAWAALQAAGAR